MLRLIQKFKEWIRRERDTVPELSEIEMEFTEIGVKKFQLGQRIFLVKDCSSGTFQVFENSICKYTRYAFEQNFDHLDSYRGVLLEFLNIEYYQEM